MLQVPCKLTHPLVLHMQKTIDNGTFTDTFFDSQAFQLGQHNKTIELRAILDYYGGSPPKCTVLFDDSWHNRQYAENIGAWFSQVNPKYGVQWHDWQSAKQGLEGRGCACGGKPQSAGRKLMMMTRGKMTSGER